MLDIGVVFVKVLRGYGWCFVCIRRWGGVLMVILEKTKIRADPYQGEIYRNLLYINSLYSYLLYLDLLTAMQLVVINHNVSPVVSGQ